jgi:hypothetical protein
MTSRQLSLTIECPDWCDESPVKHLDDGTIYHRHTLGKITGSGGASAIDDPDFRSSMEVTLERFDPIEEDGLRVGRACIRTGGDDAYDASAAWELSQLLTEVVSILDGSAAQVLAEQNAVAYEDGGHP